MIFIEFAPCGKSRAEQHAASADLAEKMILKYTGFRCRYADAERTDRGKPYFKDLRGVDFSVSHSGSVAMCAVSVQEAKDPLGALPFCAEINIRNAYFIDTVPEFLRVGADIERRSENTERLSKISKRYFTPSENEYINSTEFSSERFFEIWTKKESLGKMLGTGLSEVLYKKGTADVTDARYQTFRIKTDDEYVGAVCFGK